MQFIHFIHVPANRLRTTLAILSVCCLGMGTAGCTSGEKAEPSSAPAPSSTTATTTTTQSDVPARAASAPMPTGADLARNVSTVYAGCPAGFVTSMPENGQVFDTASGRNIDLPRPSIPAGETLQKIACTVTTVGGDLRVIYAVTTERPSRGLTPESTQTTLFAFAPASSQPLLTKPLPEDIVGIKRLAPVVDGFLGIGGDTDPGTELALFDARTLEVKQSVASTYRYDIYAGNNYDSYATSVYAEDWKPGEGRRRDVHFYSVADGSEIGNVPNVFEVISAPHGYFLTYSTRRNEDGTRPPDGVFYFDSSTRELVGPIAPRLGDLTSYRHTSPFRVDGPIWDNVALLTANLLSDTGYLKIYDLAAKKELFSLSGEELRGLTVGQAFVAGKYLYLDNESDDPVVDYTTRETASSGWSLRPAAKLADGWAVIDPGLEADSNARPHLARGGTTDYDGPWF